MWLKCSDADILLYMQVADLMDVVLKKNLSETPTKSVCVPTSQKLSTAQNLLKDKRQII